MVRASISGDEQYRIYETYAHVDHTVTAAEDAAGFVEIAGVVAHAIVISDEEYALAYLDDSRAVVSTVELINVGADTKVTFPAGLVENQTLDLYFPVTGTSCGSLPSNTNTGELALPRIQKMQNWNYGATTIEVAECGSERLVPVSFGVDGMVVLGLNRLGNTAMADFEYAKENQTDLLIDVVDTTVTPYTHDILLGVHVEDYESASEAEIGPSGVVTDVIMFNFADIEMLTNT